MNTTTIEVPTGEALPMAWPDPLPFSVRIEPTPYPVDALPPLIRDAVIEFQEFAQAPVPLVAASAIGAVSLAVQAHCNVARANWLHGPSSVFLLIVADSGERKSTCDGHFSRPIHEFEARQAEHHKPLVQEAEAAASAWNAMRDGVLEALKANAKAGKDVEDLKRRLKEIEKSKPPVHMVPRLIYCDATPEALKWALATEWPSGGILASEGGLVLGGAGMGRDSMLRALATFNQLWDGAALQTDRRSSATFTVRGARLTMVLQVQEAALRSFMEAGDLARGTGFLARFLVSWPESTQGSRLFVDPPAHWACRDAYYRRMEEILNMPVTFAAEGGLAPTMIHLSQPAKNMWVEHYNGIEKRLRTGGELYDIRDVASKTADNTARLAALFHFFEGRSGEIGLECVASAARITEWHLRESLRFLGEFGLPEGLANAARLETWLVQFCRQNGVLEVSTKDVQQRGPGRLREKNAIDMAMEELEELGRAKRVKDGRRKLIALNPGLL